MAAGVVPATGGAADDEATAWTMVPSNGAKVTSPSLLGGWGAASVADSLTTSGLGDPTGESRSSKSIGALASTLEKTPHKDKLKHKTSLGQPEDD